MRFKHGSSPAKNGTVNLQDAKARCVNGLILGGITTGFSDFLGIGPDPDPTGDFTQPARDALKNPVVRVAAAVTVSNVVRRVATRQVALRAAAAVAEDIIPVAGQLVLAYQVGHAVYSGLDYYISGSNSGACENPHE